MAGTVYKYAFSPDVYELVNGQATKINSMDELAQKGYSANDIQIKQSTIWKDPNSPDVYEYYPETGQSAKIPDMNAFTKAGYKPDQIKEGNPDSPAQRMVSSLPLSPTVSNAPTFKWSQAEIDQARTYAESVFGPYFADILSQAMEESSITTTRTNEDTTTAISQAQQTLQDYLSKADTERQRMEQDYTQARDDEAQKLGIDIETLNTNRTRNMEDKDYQLAQAMVDYERTGGRISEDKMKLLEQNSDVAAQAGLTFSGKRVEGEQNINQQVNRQVEDLNTNYQRFNEGIDRSYSRNLADLNRQEALRQEQSTKTQENLLQNEQRGLTDINTQVGQTQQSTQNYIQQQQLGQTRTLADIQRDLEKRKKAIETEKQTQIETNSAFGINAQYANASGQNINALKSDELARLDPSRIYSALSAGGYY